VRMDHRLHVGALVVDGQMHADFAGYVAAFANPAAFQPAPCQKAS
jgi:hypothetical protein